MGTWTSTTYEQHDGSLHLSCAETAKLVRKALKLAFPGQKFSVRSESYSMGASIHVTWTDGPTTQQVDRVIGVYAGADFDGMIDLKTHNDHWLEPDGSSTLAYAQGTTGSFVEQICDPPTSQSRLVSFGADFVQCQRSLSPEIEAKIQAEIAEFIGEPFPVEGQHSKRLPIHPFKMEAGEGDNYKRGSGLARDPEGGVYAGNSVWQMGALRDYSKPCEHPATMRYANGVREVCGGCGG